MPDAPISSDAAISGATVNKATDKIPIINSGTNKTLVVNEMIKSADTDATPLDTDVAVGTKTATGIFSKWTWTVIKAFLKTYNDTLYPSGSGSSTGTNTGDQTSIVGISGTKAQFDSANSDGNFLFSGDTAGGELSGTYPNPAVLNSAILAKVLTGLNISGSTIGATDTLLQAFGKLQSQLNAVLGGAIYQSVWNASTNSPTLADGTGVKGQYYVVSVDGSRDLGSGAIDFKVGDWAIHNGTIYQKVDNTDAVSSVNGFTGAVSLTSANISEVTNLYFTNARAIAAVLTGYTSGAGTVAATDTILQAIQKLNGNIAAIISLTDANLATVGHAATIKTVLVDGDEVPGFNSANSFSLIRTVWSDVFTYIKGKYDSATSTFTNKRITKRTGTTSANSATPTINTDNVDYFTITGQSNNITSFTTNLSGTPTEGQQLRIKVTASGTISVTWGASFTAGAVTLVTSITTTVWDGLFEWNGTTWQSMAKTY